ncbi:MAG: hypothetical protein QME90_03655 [Thermodesulfobacteriota bacterium]|nr:hypothetical protein [Thermodesulfobacteriota bacterium]
MMKKTDRSSRGALLIMMDEIFQREVDLRGMVLQIITDYRTITTMDIWYELGEDGRLECGISLDEVRETLSQLERQKMIARGDDDQWKI